MAKQRILFEREKACDNWVVATSRTKRSIYANALISAADACRGFSAKVGPVGAVAESFGDLKKRLIAISRNLKPKARLSTSALLLLVIVGAICVPGIVLTARPADADEPATLETVRELVARNEALINPIKMNYTVESSRTAEPPRPVGGSRRTSGRRYSHRNVVWAQSGLRQYLQINSFYSPDELARSSVMVFDDKVKTWGKLPDLMEGYSSPTDKHDWTDVLTAKLRMRPFEGRVQLSDVLVPEHAMLHPKMETVAGRDTYVVDASRPDGLAYFVRVWIDTEAGIPLRTQIFYKHPTAPDAEVILEVNEIRLHQLPNGGWIPIAGTRALHFRRSNPPHTASELISVDVSSITTGRQDIQESLFRIEFPDGASIYDSISGLTSIKGQPLKTYEQVVNSGRNFIAGTVVDQDGTPVPGFVVGPLAVSYQQSDGQSTSRIIQYPERPCAITDAKGRFAIELEQEGSYELLFFPTDHVDRILRDVPLGEHDLKVTLSKGGTVTGRVVRMLNGRNMPVANVKVEAKDASRSPAYNPRRDRMRTTTDSEGRFQIKYLATRKRKRRSGDQQEPQYVPIPWQIRCGATSQTVQFEDGIDTRDVELVIKPNPSAAASLVGRPMPGLEGLGIDVLRNDFKNRKVLLCFFDMDQRPSRNHVAELAKRVKQLEQKGVTIAAVQVSEVRPSKLDEWVKTNNIDLPVGMIEGDVEQVLFRWGVRAQPWLVLADETGVVRAEGFTLEQLDEKLDQKVQPGR